MKQFYVFWVALLSLTISFNSQAQCNYQLELTDFFGNDWDSGGNLTANTGVDITINGTTTTYLILNPSPVANQPVTETYTIPVTNGDAISIDYRSTQFPGDAQFRLLDSEGLLVYESPIAQPSATGVFVGTASCPTCPVVTNFVSTSTTANEAVLQWTAGGSETQWEIEYGISPYTVGSGGTIVPAGTNPFTLTGLTSITTYDVYIRAVCVAGSDLSNSVGPVTFTTAESCPAPSNFAPVSQTANEVQFAWDANGNSSTNYEVNYGETPFNQGDPSGQTVPGFFGSFAQVTGLMSDTEYSFYVRYDCGNGDFSLWAGPYTARTNISCPVVTGLQEDVITANSFDISWTAGGTETEWEVEYGPTGTITNAFSTPSQGTRINGLTSTNATIPGLTDSTVYDIFVRAVCDPVLPDYSSEAQITLTTLCLPFTPTTAAPYLQDFESFTATFGFQEELCWTGSSIDAYDWNLDAAGGTPSGGTGPNQAFSGTNYFYIEASSGTAGVSTATLTGPQFDLSGLTNPSVQFYYHMFGAQIGDLNFEIQTSTVPGWVTLQTISGQQQTAQADPWLLQIVNLSAYAGQTVQIRFRAVSAGTFEGDIALDDVSVGELPACPDPNLLTTDSILDTNAVLSWSENGLATVWEVEVQPTGVAQGTAGAVYENLNASNPETATGLTPETTYDYYVRSSCGVDGFSNWVGPFTFTTKCSPTLAPYVEDFEAFTVGLDFTSGNCWEASWNSTTFTEWNWNVDGAGGTPTANTGPDGANSGARYFYVEGNGGAVGNEAILLSPIVDISGLTAPAMQFASHMFGTDIGILHIDVNDGTGFVDDVFVLTGQQQATGASPWDNQIVDLLPYNATGTVQVRFRAERTHTGFTGLSDIAIDDVVFDEIPVCPPPSALSTGTITDTTTELSWRENGSATLWNIEYGPCGFTPGDGTSTTVSATTNPFTLTGLTPFTCYEYYIVADCGGGTVSTAGGPGTFTTACAVFNAPYLENFEAFTPTVNFTGENCWDTNSTSTYDWNVDNSGSTPSLNTGPTGAFSGTTYMYIEGGNGAVGSEANLLSPLIDITALTAASIQFKYHMFGATMGTLHIDVNDGSGWIDDVDTIVGQQQTAQADDWRDRIIDLTTVALTSNVIQVRLRAEKTVTGFTNDISIDDFRIDDVPTCILPNTLDATNITTTTADLSWVDANSTPAVDYTIEYAIAGTITLPNTGQGTQVPNVTNPYTLPGLLPSSSYEYYVSANCGGGNGSSFFAGPFTFNTLCADLIAPFTESFNVIDTTPNCWTQSAGTGGPWSFNGGTGFNSVTCSVAASDRTGNSGTFGWVDFSGTDTAVVLETPQIDVSALTVPYLEFYQWMCTTGYTPPNELYVEANDGTGTYTQVALINTGDAAWTKYGFSLAPFVYNTNFVQLRFRAESGGSTSDFNGDLAIDDVSVIEAPSCLSPTFLTATNVTSTTADISWTENNPTPATLWNVEVGAPGFVPNTGAQIGAVIDVNTNPATTLTGLTADTEYQYYVRAACAAGDESTYEGPFTFTTRCSPFTAPYTTNFDSDPLEGLNNCDSRVVIGSGTGTAPQVRVDDFVANSGSQHIYMYSGSSTAANSELFYITPEFSDLSSDKQVEFQVYDRDNGSLEVGIITDPTDTSTFTSLRTFTDADMADDVYQFETVYFNSLTTVGGFIAFKFIPNGTFDALYLDDINYDFAPACPAPSGLRATSVTDSTANLEWLENGTATVWEYEYDVAGFTQGSGVNGIINSTDNTTNSITGLTAATGYDYYVRAICGPTTSSTWTGPFTFFSALGSPQGVTCTTGAPGYIWEDSFETIATNWTGDVGTGTSNGQWNFGRVAPPGSAGTGPSGAFDGNGYLFFETSGTNVGPRSIVSPPIDLTGASDELELSFYYHSFGGDNTQVQVSYGTSATGPFTPVFSYTGQVQTSRNAPFQAVGAMLPATLIGQTIYIQITGTEQPGGETGFVGDVAFDLMRIQTCGSFCSTPSAVTLSNITSDSVTVGWTENGTATVWEVAVVPAGNGVPTGNGTSTTNNPYTESGLPSSSSYEVYVRADCGGGSYSDWTAVQTFSTACAPIVAPYGSSTGAAGNDFSTFPGVCWEEGDDTPVAAGPNGLDGDWVQDDFGNDPANAFGRAAKVNIYGTFGGEDAWLVSPEIDLGTGNTFTALFDVAIADWNTTTTGTMGSDDQVLFLIYTDTSGTGAGPTWNVIATYDASSNIPVTGRQESFPLAAYSGVVKFAFWATNGTVDDPEDIDFFVDNFTVDGTVGVSDVNSFEFSYYPNPTDNVVYLNGEQVMDTVTVSNLLGQQLLVVKPNATTTQVDLSNFPSGMYLIEVSSLDQSRVVKVVRN